MEDTISRVKAKCRLEALLPQWGINLVRSGDILRARCPFPSHEDRTPSFTIYPKENRFHCFGCGESGDVITFYKQYRGVDFREAVEALGNYLDTNIIQSQSGRVGEDDPPCELKTNLTDWPHGLRSWLDARGITEKTAICYGLASALYANKWDALAIPVGDVEIDGFWKLRFFRDDSPQKFLTWPKGRTQRLYMPRSPEEGEVVLLTEGELDAVRAAQEGFAVAGVPTGAKSFKAQWAGELAGYDVVIIFDNDEAGRQGALKAAEILHGTAASIRILDLPEELGKGGDLTDFFQLGVAAEDLRDLIALIPLHSSGACTPGADQDKRTVLPTEPPATLEEVEAVVTEAFGEAAWFVTRTTLATAATLLIEDVINPTGLNLIGPPSSLKTTLLGFFYDLEGIVYHSDNFTPASFVTLSKGKEEDLQKIDLLPKIKDRVFVIPELAPIFQRRREDMIENIAILTRVFDGEGLQRDGGTGSRGYKGRYLFAWLGGTTPLPPQVWNLMGKLGSRFLFLRMPETAYGADKVQRVVKNLLSPKTYKMRRMECRRVVHRFLRGLWNSAGEVHGVIWDINSIEEEYVEWIGKLARLVSVARSSVEKWSELIGEASNTHRVATVEEPDRLATILFNLARGHALIHGREYLTRDDIGPVVEVALCSMPDIRSQALNLLLSSPGGICASNIIENSMRVSRPTALDAMRVLETVGLVNYAVGTGSTADNIELKGEFKWALDEDFQALRAPNIKFYRQEI